MTLADLATVLRAAAAEAERLAALEAQAPALQAPSEWLTLQDSGLSVRTLRAAIASGELDAVRVGREYRVRRSDLEAWIGGRRVTPEPRPEKRQSAAERALERARRDGSLRLVGGR